jgi:dihydropyrimidine dehydrogenase (NADP+)
MISFILYRDQGIEIILYIFFFQKWPYFGHYQSLREDKISEMKKQADLLSENLKPPLRSCYEPTKPVPAVKNVIGQALSMIGPYKGLDNKQQVVAVIDDVSK